MGPCSAGPRGRGRTIEKPRGAAALYPKQNVPVCVFSHEVHSVRKAAFRWLRRRVLVPLLSARTPLWAHLPQPCLKPVLLTAPPRIPEARAQVVSALSVILSCGQRSPSRGPALGSSQGVRARKIVGGKPSFPGASFSELTTYRKSRFLEIGS